MSEDHAKRLSRRDVLVAGALGAAAAAFDVGPGRSPAAAAAPGPVRTPGSSAASVESTHMPTTLEKRVVPGHLIFNGKFGPVVEAAGEAHTVRQELAGAGASATMRPLLAFAQMSDLHVIDDKSPARLENLDAYVWSGYKFESSYRPQEMLSMHMTNAAVRAISKVAKGPATGLPLQFAIVTGDSTDNCQKNETLWYMRLLNGGPVLPRSGSAAEESVHADLLRWDWNNQSVWSTEYWHPEHPDDPFNPGIVDRYHRAGFPLVPGLLSAARAEFEAFGLRKGPSGPPMPWFAAYGNHDRNIQGNVSQGKFWAGGLAKDYAVGGKKPFASSAPLNVPAPANGEPTTLDMAEYLYDLGHANVAADPQRRILSRQEWIQAHFDDGGAPLGHGFQGTDKAYYRFAVPAGREDLFTFVCLDTTKDDSANGNIDGDQMAWLENQLMANSSRFFGRFGGMVTQNVADRLFVIYGHHHLGSIDNGAALRALLLRFPNVIMFVNGHTHENRIIPHAQPASSGVPGGFWEINTASHIDWPIQSRLIEIGVSDNVLSIFTTMVDIDAPLQFDPTNLDDTQLASLGRQLAANDLHGPVRRNAVDSRSGTHADRNTQLLLPCPFPLEGIRAPRLAAALNRDGRMDMFALNGAASPFLRFQTVAGGAWSAWSQHDGSPQAIAIEQNDDDRLELFGIYSNGFVAHKWQQGGPGGGWSVWKTLPSVERMAALAAARNVDGRLDLYGVGPDGRSWVRWQNSRPTASAPEGSWSVWTLLPGTQVMRTVAAERNLDGRILLLGIDQHGRVFQRWQNTPMGGWTDWTAVPGHLRSIAVVRNIAGPQNGRLQLFGSDHMGHVWSAVQTSPGSGTWTPFTQIPRTSTGFPGDVVSVAAEANHDGRIDLFALTSSHQLFLTWQTTAGGPWAGWQNQAAMTPTPVAVPNLDRMTLDQARAALESRLLPLGSFEEERTRNDDYAKRVIRSGPAFGSVVTPGTSVTVVLGKFIGGHF